MSRIDEPSFATKQTNLSQLVIVSPENVDNEQTCNEGANHEPIARAGDHWPSAWQTWRTYWYIGRWNYFKGMIAVGVISGLLASMGYGNSAILVLLFGLSYILVSGFGLFLLYGPPSRRIFRKLLSDAAVKGPVRVVDIHFGTWRCTRAALELLPDATVHAIGVQDPDHESEQAVVDVWKFERPPVSHARFSMDSSTPGVLPVPSKSADVLLLGFGIHEVHEGPERDALMRELHRVLADDGKLLLIERGWSPLLALVFGPLFLHFTPAREWDRWLRENFQIVQRGSMFGMVDMFVASGKTRWVARS